MGFNQSLRLLSTVEPNETILPIVLVISSANKCNQTDAEMQNILIEKWTQAAKASPILSIFLNVTCF